VWRQVLAHQEGLDLAAKRSRQQVEWTWTLVRDRLLAELRNDPEVAAISAGVEREVLAGTLPPSLAADRLLSVFKRGT
jgi:LAO/AO transport system kinase